MGLYLQNDSYLISNSPNTIRFASKLNLRFSTLIWWNGLICRLIIKFAYSSILMKISENKENYIKANINWILPVSVLFACSYIISDTIWQVHQIVIYKIISFAYSWILIKLKIEVRSWNNYLPPPPPTHTHLGRGVLIRLTLHPRTITHGCEIVQWDHSIPKFLLLPKINLFGLLKIAWCPWQPIGHCSWVICKQTQDRHLRATPSFMDFFVSSTNSRKQVVSYLQNKMVAK